MGGHLPAGPVVVTIPMPLGITTPITVTTVARPLYAPAAPDSPAAAGPALDELLDEPDELGGFEGLGEEGVNADIKPCLHFVLSTGADDGKRKMMGARIGTKPSGGPEPVETRHDDVEGDDIGPHLVHDIQTLGTVDRGHDLKPLQLEVDPDQLPDDLVVVDNKHPTRRAWHNSRVGPDRPPRPAFPHFQPLRGTPPDPTPGNLFLITPEDLIVFYTSPRASSSTPDTPP
ncbi:hypothetical protein HGI09_19690 [Streptomyces collinus]|nr:hypothetical protein HGI10_44430 [Streptomyces collinus]UJA14658.1 hypothetical protein HGI09_19690 [Streptomyces collinus]